MSLGEATVHIFCISVLVFLKVSFRDPIHNRIGNVVLAGYSAVVIMIFLFSLTGFRDLYACKPISKHIKSVSRNTVRVCAVSIWIRCADIFPISPTSIRTPRSRERSLS